MKKMIIKTYELQFFIKFSYIYTLIFNPKSLYTKDF